MRERSWNLDAASVPQPSSFARRTSHGYAGAVSKVFGVSALLALVVAASGCQDPPAEAQPSSSAVEASRPPTAGTNATPPRAEAPAFPPLPTDAERSTTQAVLGLSGRQSTSIGGPNDGLVEGAVALPMRGPGFRFGPARDPAARFGTVETVQALIRAALRVEERLPGSQLTINDLGLEQGGAIAHHGSHRAGRDADVLFYVLDSNGNPRAGIGAPIEPDGSGMDYRDLSVSEDDVPIRLDVPRSWAFVEALLEDPAALVQRVFVVEHVRTMLLAHARRVEASPATIARFADVSCQPSYPHDDHFHVRFFCTSEDIRRGCTDSMPIYPWHLAMMRTQGVRPTLQIIRRDRPRAEIVTEAEARADAGVMHADVAAFLARRESWREQPHPGRRYCR